MESKIDIKKLQFGSKIDKDSKEREEYYFVKSVLSPNTVILSNGLTIKLIGIKEKPSVNGSATRFLIEKTKGRKVFLKYDSVKYDSDNTLLCYLYLDNKTFINAHMLKNGLAEVDMAADFKYKSKFITYSYGK
jgi:site-specific DNA-methyltransferase (adenine-specific)